MKNIDNRSFEEVVRSITQSEEDVDRILKAAKLERIESAKEKNRRFEILVDLAETFLCYLPFLIIIACMFALVLQYTPR